MGVIGNKRSKELHNEVNLANRRITQMNKSGLYDIVPVGYTYNDLISRINSQQDYYDIIELLRMSDERRNPGAQTPVEFQGQTVPKYMVDMLTEHTDGINRRNERILNANYPNWNEMDTVQKASRLANVNLSDYNIEDYTLEDLNELFNERFPSLVEKAEMYIETWLDWGGDPKVPEIIRKLIKENPDRFIRVMMSNDERKELYYVYPSTDLVSSSPISKSNKRGWEYKKGSPNKTPMQTREENVIDFWEGVRAGRILP